MVRSTEVALLAPRAWECIRSIRSVEREGEIKSSAKVGERDSIYTT